MQNKKQLFNKYYKRMMLQGILKTVIYAVAIGFCVNFLVSAISWLTGYENGLWLSIGLSAGAMLLSGVLLYVIKFKPTTIEIARKVDSLGLEERLITMLEIEGDQSYIAQRQREDAKRCLAEVDATRIKFVLSAAAIIFTIIAVIMGSLMTTVVVLAKEGVISQGDELIFPDAEREDLIEVTYEIEEGGEIVGEEIQLITKGSDATPVTAVAIEGWVFLEWSDGENSPERHDRGLTENFEVKALFAQMIEGDEEDATDETGTMNGSGDNEGDAPDDAPGGESDGDDGSESENQGNQNEDESDGNGAGDDSNTPGEDGGTGAGGKWDDKNQIYDGETYYKDLLDYYYDLAMQIIADGGEVPPEIIEFIEKYYDSI